MSLDEKAEKWLKNYKRKYPWLNDMIEKYGLDLSLYDSNEEYDHAFPSDILNRAHFIEDTHFLKTFDEYVKERLSQNFSSVLEVGIGKWSYVSAMTTFFRKYNNQAPILGIDKEPWDIKDAKKTVKNRNVTNVEPALADITQHTGNYDVVVNLCLNIIDAENIFDYKESILRGELTYKSTKDFLRSIWENTSENGLFIMGINESHSQIQFSEEKIRAILTHSFKDMDIHKNKYSTDKSIYPINYLITAKPKLSTEVHQS